MVPNWGIQEIDPQISNDQGGGIKASVRTRVEENQVAVKKLEGEC